MVSIPLAAIAPPAAGIISAIFASGATNSTSPQPIIPTAKSIAINKANVGNTLFIFSLSFFGSSDLSGEKNILLRAIPSICSKNITNTALPLINLLASY